MEEEKMVKKENEVTNMNDSKNKNGIIAVLIVIIIALIGAVVYFAFIKKDDKPVDNNGGNNQQEHNNTGNEETPVNTTELKISKIEFTDDKLEQEVILNNKKIKVKRVNQDSNSFLYINGVKVNIEEWEWNEIYSTGNLLLLTGSDICGTIINYAVNENGKLIKVTKNYSEANGDNGGEYYLNGESIKVENGKIVAEIGHVSDCRCEAPDDSCEKNYRGMEKVEIVYDGENVTIKK